MVISLVTAPVPSVPGTDAEAEVEATDGGVFATVLFDLLAQASVMPEQPLSAAPPEASAEGAAQDGDALGGGAPDAATLAAGSAPAFPDFVDPSNTTRDVAIHQVPPIPNRVPAPQTTAPSQTREPLVAAEIQLAPDVAVEATPAPKVVERTSASVQVPSGEQLASTEDDAQPTTEPSLPGASIQESLSEAGAPPAPGRHDENATPAPQAAGGNEEATGPLEAAWEPIPSVPSPSRGGNEEATGPLEAAAQRRPAAGAAASMSGSDPVAETGPVRVEPMAGGAAPRAATTIVSRLIDVIERLRHAPPPQRLTVELPDGDGMRVQVSLEFGGVRLALVDAGLSVSPHTTLGELSDALSERGFDLAGGEQRNHEQDDETPQTDPAPQQRRRGSGLRL